MQLTRSMLTYFICIGAEITSINPPTPPPSPQAGGDQSDKAEWGRYITHASGWVCLMAVASLTVCGPFQSHCRPMSPGVSTPVCWVAAQVAFTTAQSCGLGVSSGCFWLR